MKENSLLFIKFKTVGFKCRFDGWDGKTTVSAEAGKINYIADCVIFILRSPKMDVLAQRIKRTVILIDVLLILLLNKRCHKCQFLRYLVPEWHSLKPLSSPKPRSLYQDNITRLTNSLLIIQRTMLLCILHNTINMRISTRIVIEINANCNQGRVHLYHNRELLAI